MSNQSTCSSATEGKANEVPDQDKVDKGLINGMSDLYHAVEALGICTTCKHIYN